MCAGFGGEQNGGNMARVVVCLELLEGFDAVEVGHHDVEEDCIGLVGDRLGDAFLPRSGGEDVPGGSGGEGEADDVADASIVIDDQDVFGEHGMKMGGQKRRFGESSVRGGDGMLGDRKHKREAAAFGDRAFCPNLSSVLLDDTAADCQS